MKLLEREEFAAALELLSASQRRCPGNGVIRELIFDAERGLEESVQDDFDPSSIPVLTKTVEEIQQMRLPAGAAYMSTLVDGFSDIRSILWLAPMRTVEALCSLKRLRDLDLIELTEAN